MTLEYQCETLQRQWTKQIVTILENLLNVPFQTFKSIQRNSTNIHWEGIKKMSEVCHTGLICLTCSQNSSVLVLLGFPVFKPFNYMLPVSFLLILATLPWITVLVWASLFKYVGPPSGTWFWKFISDPLHMVDLICQAMKCPLTLTGVCPLTTWWAVFDPEFYTRNDLLSKSLIWICCLSCNSILLH